MSESSIMTLADFSISEMTAEAAAALETHNNIIGAMYSAASAVVEMCKNLKQMRDTVQYKALGFQTFEEYTEKACGIKQRQAYNYIKTYERLGVTFLQSNAQLGITKLQLLTEVCAVDRTNFVEENDLEGMSVAEIKELIAREKEFSEQIDLLKDADAQQKQAIERLKDENKSLRDRPVEVAVQQPTKEQIDAAAAKQIDSIKKDYREKLEKAKHKLAQKAEKEKQEAIEEAKAAAKAETEQIYREEIEKAEQEKEEAVKKAESMAATLDKNANKELVTASLYFSEAQTQLGKFMTAANSIAATDAEKGGKLRKVAADFLAKYIDQLTN